MYTETEGIILKQTKITGGRRMLTIFTKKFGKISAGTSLNERGKNKTALALRPFTYGKYELNKQNETYHISGGDVINSHFAIGEDVDKFAFASYILELTDKLLPEDAPSLPMFLLLTDFLGMMEARSKNVETLVIGYQVKALKNSGSEPSLDSCVLCGAKEELTGFSVPMGGVVCKDCRRSQNMNERLLYEIEFDIVNILRYIMESPLTSLKRLALDDRTLLVLRQMMRSYFAYHMDINGLKSEDFMLGHYE